MDAVFTTGADGAIQIDLGDRWPGFNEALADAVTTRAQRGSDGVNPSTYWIDRVLAVLEQPADGEQVLAPGNDTDLVRIGDQVVAQSQYELFADEAMPLAEFTEVLELWRAKVEEARAREKAEIVAARAVTAARIIAGVIFEDCGFHPVLCTLASPEEDELQGISLIDGQIRSCSMFHCGPELLSLGQVLAIKKDFAAHVAARTAGGELPVDDDLLAVEAPDVMGMAVPVRPYAPETGVRLFWAPGARIEVGVEGAEVHVKANSAGLLSLASHLLALHQYPVPDGSHIHLDEFSGLEDGSAEVVIERG